MQECEKHQSIAALYGFVAFLNTEHEFTDNIQIPEHFNIKFVNLSRLAHSYYVLNMAQSVIHGTVGKHCRVCLTVDSVLKVELITTYAVLVGNILH